MNWLIACIAGEASRQVSDYQFKLSKAEQDISSLESNVSENSGWISTSVVRSSKDPFCNLDDPIKWVGDARFYQFLCLSFLGRPFYLKMLNWSAKKLGRFRFRSVTSDHDSKCHSAFILDPINLKLQQIILDGSLHHCRISDFRNPVMWLENAVKHSLWSLSGGPPGKPGETLQNGSGKRREIGGGTQSWKTEAHARGGWNVEIRRCCPAVCSCC